MSSTSVAVIIIGTDLAGQSIPESKINDLLEQVCSQFPEALFYFAHRVGSSPIDRVHLTNITFKIHPVEVLLTPEVRDCQVMIVLSGNQQIGEDWGMKIIKLLFSDPVCAVQSELGIYSNIGTRKIFYPFPGWRNLGNVFPLLEHGGFAIKSCAITALHNSGHTSIKNWISLTEQLLSSGNILASTRQIKTTEDIMSCSLFKSALEITRNAFAMLPVMHVSKKSADRKSPKFSLQKIDAARSIISRLTISKQTISLNILRLYGALISLLISAIHVVSRHNSIKRFPPKIAIAYLESSTLSLSPAFWMLLEDDRVRLGKWNGEDNIIARSISNLLFRHLITGESDIKKICSDISAIYQQPQAQVEKDINDYLIQLISSGIFIQTCK